MFSVIFPGQGSQIIGMGKEFYDKYKIVRNLFEKADDVLGLSLSKIILEGPKDQLDLTKNTQPAIFLISYSIFEVATKELNVDLNRAKFFAGHSLGEYSALSSAGYLNFSDTIKLLRIRGNAMQTAIPEGEGGMVAVLGSTIKIVEEILDNNQNKSIVQIANDNSEGQIVLSGKNDDLIKLIYLNPQFCHLIQSDLQNYHLQFEHLNFAHYFLICFQLFQLLSLILRPCRLVL